LPQQEQFVEVSPLQQYSNNQCTPTTGTTTPPTDSFWENRLRKSPGRDSSNLPTESTVPAPRPDIQTTMMRISMGNPIEVVPRPSGFKSGGVRRYFEGMDDPAGRRRGRGGGRRSGLGSFVDFVPATPPGYEEPVPVYNTNLSPFPVPKMRPPQEGSSRIVSMYNNTNFTPFPVPPMISSQEESDPDVLPVPPMFQRSPNSSLSLGAGEFFPVAGVVSKKAKKRSMDFSADGEVFNLTNWVQF
jgi:hypothetical protein